MPSLQLRRKTLEHTLGRRSIARRHATESGADRRFHGSALVVIDPGATCRKVENGAPLIARIARAGQQLLRY